MIERRVSIGNHWDSGVTYDVCRTPEKHGSDATAAEASVEEWQVGNSLFRTDVAVEPIIDE